MLDERNVLSHKYRDVREVQTGWAMPYKCRVLILPFDAKNEQQKCALDHV